MEISIIEYKNVICIGLKNMLLAFAKKKKKMCANMKMYLGACVQIKKSLQDF